MTRHDQRTRRAMLRRLVATSHTDLDGLMTRHRAMMQRDPMFYGQLAIWYQKRGRADVVQDVFLAHLLDSPREDHREAARNLLRRLPTPRAANVVTLARRDPQPHRERRPGVLTRAARRARRALTRLLDPSEPSSAPRPTRAWARLSPVWTPPQAWA